MPYSTATGCYTGSCNYLSSNVNQTGSIQAVSLGTWDAVRSHIKNYGPVSTGFNVYSDFPGFQDSVYYTFPSTYVWPGTKTFKLLGGHAVMCYGFDDNMLNGVTATSVGVFFCKNSWGTGWFVYFFSSPSGRSLTQPLSQGRKRSLQNRLRRRRHHGRRRQHLWLHLHPRFPAYHANYANHPIQNNSLPYGDCDSHTDLDADETAGAGKDDEGQEMVDSYSANQSGVAM